MLLFLSPITILGFDSYAVEEYGKIRADLERKGTPIGPFDMLIAGHAKSEGLTVVTNNTREFCRFYQTFENALYYRKKSTIIATKVDDRNYCKT